MNQHPLANQIPEFESGAEVKENKHAPKQVLNTAASEVIQNMMQPVSLTPRVILGSLFSSLITQLGVEPSSG